MKQIKKIYAILVSKRKDALGLAGHAERHWALSVAKGERKTVALMMFPWEMQDEADVVGLGWLM